MNKQQKELEGLQADRRSAKKYKLLHGGAAAISIAGLVAVATAFVAPSFLTMSVFLVGTVANGSLAFIEYAKEMKLTDKIDNLRDQMFGSKNHARTHSNVKEDNRNANKAKITENLSSLSQPDRVAPSGSKGIASKVPNGFRGRDFYS